MAPWPPVETLLAAWAGPLSLVLARVVGLMATAPAWSAPALGWRIRLGLTLLLTAIVAPAVLPVFPSPTPARGTALAVALAGEAGVGAALGLAFGLVIAGARQAGELIGVQAGLATATVLDPEAGDGLTATGHLYALLALAAFLTLDGPLVLVSSLIQSYQAFPLGEVVVGLETVEALFARVGWALGLSLRAAAPVGVAVLAAGLGLGLLSRVGGALQLASLTWPVRSLIAVVLVLATLGASVELLRGAWTVGLADPTTVLSRVSE